MTHRPFKEIINEASIFGTIQALLWSESIIGAFLRAIQIYIKLNPGNFSSTKKGLFTSNKTLSLSWDLNNERLSRLEESIHY